MYKNRITKYQIQMKNISPLIIGNGEEGIGNLQIQGNVAKIPATTIAGLFRSFLRYKEDNAVYRAVFLEDINSSKIEKRTRTIYRYQSMITIEDSFSEQNIDMKSDIGFRTNIKINPETGAAEEHKLFETYYIKPNKSFLLSVELRKLWRDHPQIKKDILLNGDSSNYDLEDWNSQDEEIYLKLKDYFEEFIQAINLGEISIGASENKGFGRFCIEKTAKMEYDLEDKKQVRDYINSKGLKLEVYSNTDKTSRKKVGYNIFLNCSEGMIIKDKIIPDVSNGNAKMTDSYCERDGNVEKYIIPASTLKGFLRGYFEKQVSIESETSKAIVNRLFGDEESKGKLKFNDLELNEVTKLPKTRIQIDRFTGGAISGALIKEQLISWSDTNWNLDLTNLDSDELKLANKMIIYLLQDIKVGKINIGSGKGVGYGKLELGEISYYDERQAVI